MPLAFRRCRALNSDTSVLKRRVTSITGSPSLAKAATGSVMIMASLLAASESARSRCPRAWVGVSGLSGSVLDIAVDVRHGSPTFGQHLAVELSEENRRQLWIPRGFAHGFVVQSETADFFYKCDEVYSPADELVLRWNDPQLGIDWGCDSPKVSTRDSAGSTFAQLAGRLPRYETA